MGIYSLEEGSALVKAARHTVELYLKSAKFNRNIIERMISNLDRHHGIFIEIKHYPLEGLRGAAVLTKKDKPIKTILVDAAISAAIEDRRHVPVSHHELEHIIFEVSVIPPPIKLKKDSKLKVRPGKEGVVLEYGYRNSLLLPAEIKKGEKEDIILKELCKRAGMRAQDWKRTDLSLYKFMVQTFQETEPYGPVEEVS